MRHRLVDLIIENDNRRDSHGNSPPNLKNKQGKIVYEGRPVLTEEEFRLYLEKTKNIIHENGGFVYKDCLPEKDQEAS